ncbi:MAG: Holliday junction resolvase RuvX [Nitrospinota bacterium]|nr:Holliday junction resolvase RuvX [Nitrospinota bacterium]
MGRTLAFDIGEKRTGAAITDQLYITAQAVGVRERVGYKSEVAWVRELMQKYDIERIVVGHPVGLSGQLGERAVACASIAKKLGEELGLEVVLWDERLTTAEADSTMKQAGLSRKKRKKSVDQMAAQLILSGWLACGGHETSEEKK